MNLGNTVDRMGETVFTKDMHSTAAPTNASTEMDRAAEATTAVVAQAMRVRNVGIDAAITIVADATGTATDMIEAMIARFAMMSA